MQYAVDFRVERIYSSNSGYEGHLRRGRLVYITGTPGTGIANSLARFADWKAHSGGEPAEVIKLEEVLLQSASKEIHEILPEAVERPDGKADLFDLLSLPKTVLYRLWTVSFRKAIKKAKRLRGEGRDVILTFHACWYHLGNREYISAINFEELRHPDARADLLITLVDDIYDVRSRLSTGTGVLASHIASENETLDVLLKLLLILDWRAFEIALSERVAAAVKAGHHVFAVKHPLVTLDALLQGKRTMYLSHHITQLRVMLRAGRDPTKAQELIDELSQLARKLRACCCLLEPTAIDEGRFNTKIWVESKELLVAQIDPRWPLPAPEKELLWDPPVKPLPELGKLPEYLQNLLARPDEVLADPAIVSKVHVTHALIRALNESVTSQINSRDHFLVEHTAGIIAYRPYLLGHEAGGVREELEHYKRLQALGMAGGAAFALHPPADESARPLIRALAILQRWCEGNEIHGTPEDKAAFLAAVRNSDLGQTLSDPNRRKAHLARDLTATLQSLNLSLTVPSGTAGALGGALALQQKRAADVRAGELYEDLGGNYLKKMGESNTVEVIQEELSAEEFAERVARKLERRHKGRRKR